MTRLKERLYRIYKLNYPSMKTIMDGQKADMLPVKPEIENKLTIARER